MFCASLLFSLNVWTVGSKYFVRLHKLFFKDLCFISESIFIVFFWLDGPVLDSPKAQVGKKFLQNGS